MSRFLKTVSLGSWLTVWLPMLEEGDVVTKTTLYHNGCQCAETFVGEEAIKYYALFPKNNYCC